MPAFGISSQDMRKTKLHSACAKQKISRNIVNCAWTWKLSEVLDTFFPVYISNISFGLVYCASPVKLKLITHFLGENVFCTGGLPTNPMIFNTEKGRTPRTLGRGIASNKSTWGVGGNGSNIKSLELSRTLEAAKGLELPPPKWTNVPEKEPILINGLSSKHCFSGDMIVLILEYMLCLHKHWVFLWTCCVTSWSSIPCCIW